VESTI